MPHRAENPSQAVGIRQKREIRHTNGQGSEKSGDAAGPANPELARRGVYLIAFVVLVLRLIHLAAAVRSPTLYQLGPDETYYLQFARAVASGQPTLLPEFVFMDPLFAYLLGGLVALFGDQLFPVFLLNALLDTLTALVVYRIASELRGYRAGLVAMILYGLCSTAIFYSATLLRETWVALFLASLTWVGLRLVHQKDPWTWLAFGALCGLGVALRSNLLIAGASAVILLPLLAWRQQSLARNQVLLAASGLAIGLACVLGILGLRNSAVSGTWGPMPNNGGPVLHHTYNAGNPGAYSIFPDFVSYAEPLEMWRGYRDEAIRRKGHALSPQQVSAYWTDEALTYINSHRAQTARNLLRKSAEFFSWREVGNNRAFADEQMFSPLLRWLPMPSGWLIALGLPGLLFADRSLLRRSWLFMVPLLAFATFVVFYAESRFRFVAMPLFAVGAGIFLVSAFDAARGRRWGLLLMFAMMAAVPGIAGIVQTASMPVPQANWVRLGWGIARTGDFAQASEWAERSISEGKEVAKAQELLGYLALRQARPAAAVAHFAQAVRNEGARWHVAHYNLALAWAQTGALDSALDAVRTANLLSPNRDYATLQFDLLVVTGDNKAADDLLARYPLLLPEASRRDPASALARLAKLGIQPVASGNSPAAAPLTHSVQG